MIALEIWYDNQMHSHSVCIWKISGGLTIRLEYVEVSFGDQKGVDQKKQQTYEAKSNLGKNQFCILKN